MANEVSKKFSQIENNLTRIFSLIYTNSNINKYIYYLTNDPLSEPKVPIDLYENGNYFLTFFDGSIPNTEKIRIYINAVSGNFTKTPLSTIKILVEVVIPNKYSYLAGMGQVRAIRIFDEISQMVDQQKVAGITDAHISNYSSGKIANTEYCAFVLEISVNSSTLKG